MAKSNTPDPVNPFGELSKLIEQFKLPGVDMNSIVESRRKDMETLLASNKAALESMQQLATKQAEFFSKAMHSAQENFQALTQAGGDPVKQTELARKVYEKAVADMSEMANMARKAQTDAVSAIGQRVQAGIDEMKKLAQPK